MNHRRQILAFLIAVQVCGAAAVRRCAAQAPVRPIPAERSQAILPTGISDEDVELFGRFCYLWREPPDTEVVQYVGEFALHMGQRRISSNDAVVWIHRARYAGRVYAALEIFLWRDARLIEPGGTVTRGKVLFVTLNTFGKVRLNSSATVARSAADTKLYQQASRVREAFLASAAAKPPDLERVPPVNVLEMPPARAVRIRPPRRRVTYRAKKLESEVRDGQRVVIATGDVYVAQAGQTPGDFLEIRADAAVLWLRGAALAESLGRALLGPAGVPATQPAQAATKPAARPAEEELPPEPAEAFAGIVVAAYLEGDVVLSLGDRMMRARRLYYDFEMDRAYVLDAVVRIIEPRRNLPIYIRADRVRQLARDRYLATNAKITTSEFYAPHYHLGAQRVLLIDRTPRDAAGRVMGFEAGTFAAENVTFNVGGVPLLYWPSLRGDLRRSEVALRRFRMWYSDDFGLSARTRWELFSALGLATPEGFDGILHLDYYGRRGPAVGADLDYTLENAFGLFRGYYVHDTGEDNLGLLRNKVEPEHPNRGRLLWRHRHYLPRDWQVTLELSYLSDPNFLEEYFEAEFDEGKEQETLIYAKKQRDNWAFTTLLQWRINDFLTQTEHLPDFAFYLSGEPLLGNAAVLFSEARAGVVRFRPDERRLFNENRFIDNTEKTDSTARLDIREELDVPVDIGPLRLVPFGVIRGTYWDGTTQLARGAATRGFFSYGLRGSAYAWKVYENVQSRLLDLHRLRHVIKPDFTLWFSESNIPSRDLTPFDSGIETIDDFDGVTVGLRQLLQTQRGGPGKWRSVDWLTLDVELGLFDDATGRHTTHGEAIHSRPEESLASSFVNTNLTWRVSDTTALVYESNYDLNDGRMDVQDLSLAVQRDPRLAYFLGWRYIRRIDSNLIGFGANYKAAEVHTFALREYFDIDRGETLEFSVTYIRKLPRWYVAATFELDEAEDDIGVSLAAWPEGLPEATLGTRKYTGLVRSVGLRP